MTERDLPHTVNGGRRYRRVRALGGRRGKRRPVDGDDGFVVEGTEEKPGDKGCPTAELRFDELWIPEERRLGTEGREFVQALKTLNCGRITIAARSIGIAQAALDEAVAYVREREQFGQPITELQAIQHKLADMDTKTRAARLLMNDAADKKIRGEDFIKEAAQAKLYASEVLREVANEGSRSTAMAIRRISPPNGSIGMPNSTRSTRGRAKSFATRSRDISWGNRAVRAQPPVSMSSGL